MLTHSAPPFAHCSYAVSLVQKEVCLQGKEALIGQMDTIELAISISLAVAGLWLVLLAQQEQDKHLCFYAELSSVMLAPSMASICMLVVCCIVRR